MRKHESILIQKKTLLPISMITEHTHTYHENMSRAQVVWTCFYVIFAQLSLNNVHFSRTRHHIRMFRYDILAISWFSCGNLFQRISDTNRVNGLGRKYKRYSNSVLLSIQSNCLFCNDCTHNNKGRKGIHLLKSNFSVFPSTEIVYVLAHPARTQPFNQSTYQLNSTRICRHQSRKSLSVNSF